MSEGEVVYSIRELMEGVQSDVRTVLAVQNTHGARLARVEEQVKSLHAIRAAVHVALGRALAVVGAVAAIAGVLVALLK